MNRPEMTNLNHQYAIRRVDMDFSWMPKPGFGLHKEYRRPLRAGVNCFTSGAAHASVNDGDLEPTPAQSGLASLQQRFPLLHAIDRTFDR